MNFINGTILFKILGGKDFSKGVGTYHLLGHQREDFSLGHLSVKLKEDYGLSLNGTKFITLPLADDFC